MRKIAILLFVLFLSSCKADLSLSYSISDSASIHVKYYYQFSVDQESSVCDTLQLDLNGSELSNYSIFQNIINQAQKEDLDPSNIILGDLVGWYVLRFYNDGIQDLSIQFRIIDANDIHFEVYTIEDNKAVDRYVMILPMDQSLSDFLDYVNSNGVFQPSL